jgi:hypothetical protein
MADVYSGSYLNLAASAAQDGRDGLFFARRESVSVRCKLSTGEEDSISVSKELRDGEIWTCWNELMSSPLSLRAWTMQERILPPRTVIFGREQLLWECHEDLKSETVFSSLDHGSLLSSNIRQCLISRTLPREGTSYLCALWYWMIQAYSKCHLTKSEDKLPALSGLAKAFSRRTSFMYTAGLWEEDLATGLLWLPLLPESRPRPSTYRAPSWSWVSLNTPIHFYAAFQPGGIYNSLSRTCALRSLMLAMTYLGQSQWRVDCFL